jgi:hypothetical protein
MPETSLDRDGESLDASIKRASLSLFGPGTKTILLGGIQKRHDRSSMIGKSYLMCNPRILESKLKIM